MKKFELTTEFITNILGTKLFKVRALVSFGDVEAGDFGGYVEKEYNIEHCGNAWVYGDAQVCGDAWVCGDARVYGDADYVYIHGFGSANRTTTFYRNKIGGVSVRCGCFSGTIDDFRDKVKNTHGENKYGAEYLMMADLMQRHFEN